MRRRHWQQQGRSGCAARAWCRRVSVFLDGPPQVCFAGGPGDRWCHRSRPLPSLLLTYGYVSQQQQEQHNQIIILVKQPSHV